MYEDVVNEKKCRLTADMLKQLKSGDGSEWLIDNNALEILGNNPQELIPCTKRHDRVTFILAGMHKFNQTMVVFHDLEFISKSSEANDIHNETRSVAVFTCPEAGPFLTIKYAKVGSVFS